MFSEIQRVRRVGVGHEAGFAVEPLLKELGGAGYAVNCYSGSTDLGLLQQLSIELLAIAGQGSWVHQEIGRLRGLGFTLPLLAICAKPSGETCAEMLRRGADDYLPAQFNAAELEARVEALLRRVSWGTEEATDEFQVCPNTQVVRIQGVTLWLTPVPFRVLLCLAEHRGSWVSTQEILRVLPPAPRSPRSSVVRVHIHTIRAALGPLSHLVEADYRYGRGYRLRLPPANARLSSNAEPHSLSKPRASGRCIAGKLRDAETPYYYRCAAPPSQDGIGLTPELLASKPF